jgi:RNA polymerase sigma-70 factor (ECF subfamily)
MQLALAGDAKAYQQFLAAMAALLRPSLARKMQQIRASQDVEDIVQDILIAIHNKRHTYDVSKPVLPWVRAIAHYKWVDYVRSTLRRPMIVDVEDITLFADIQDQAAQSTALQDVEHFLSALPANQAQLVRLAKLQGKSMEEIAQHTQLSVGAVKVTLHRAMHKLKKLANRADQAAGGDR